jgi:hypothetical protein
MGKDERRKEVVGGQCIALQLWVHRLKKGKPSDSSVAMPLFVY